MKRIPTELPRGQAITVDLEGEAVPAFEGEPVAVSLLAAGERVFARSVKYHRPRAPFCFEGGCSHCLMRVDGTPNQYTCRTPARPGMKLERQNAYPSAKVDVFAAIDFLFPRGLDHHEMFAGVPVAEQVMAKVARHLAGLGNLPDRPAPARLPSMTVQTRVAIAGGGAAGSAAAEVLAQKGIPFQLFEHDAFLGGRLLKGAKEPGAPEVPAVTGAGVRLQSSVIGLFDDEHGRYFAVIQHIPGEPRLLKVYADAFVIAVGGHAELLPFENNDLPGVYAGRAVSTLIRRHGLLPGEKIAVVGRGPELYPLAKLIESVGGVVPVIAELGERLSDGAPSNAVVGTVAKAHGRGHVSAVSLLTTQGQKKFHCDAVALSLPPSPGFELARQGGAKVSYDQSVGNFVVEADGSGLTQCKGLYVAGDAQRPMTSALAFQHGKAVAEAVARSLS